MVHGVDVSNNNGMVNWTAVRKAGVRFAWLKVSEGSSFVDSRYRDNDRAARAAGIVVGGYHFGHPSGSPGEQADRFLTLLTLRPGDLLPALDIETTDGLSGVQVQRWAAEWLACVQKKIGARPVIYSGDSFLRTNLPELARSHPVWVASYGARPKSRWDAWQYTDKGPLRLDGSVAPNLVTLQYRPPLRKKVVRPAARAVAPLWRRFGRI